MLPSGSARERRSGRWRPPTFDRAERTRLRWVLVGSVVGVVLLGAAMLVVSAPMTRGGAPSIVAFELAESGAAADRIMEEWGPQGRSAARWSLVLDYGWLVLYTAALMSASVLLAEIARDHSWSRAQRLGWLVAGLALVAGFLDAIENTALLIQLSRGGLDAAALVARVAAIVKFALVGVALAYVVVVGAACALRRPARRHDQAMRATQPGEQQVRVAGPRSRSGGAAEDGRGTVSR